MPSQAALRAAANLRQRYNDLGLGTGDEIAAIIDAEFADVRLALEEARRWLPGGGRQKTPGGTESLSQALPMIEAALAKVQCHPEEARMPHEWRNDGTHFNEFCKHCFATKTSANEQGECFTRFAAARKATNA